MFDSIPTKPIRNFSKRFTICPASRDEAADLADLAVIASDGLTLATWEARRGGDASAIDVGRQRAARASGAFSYRNAEIALQNHRVIAGIISYPLTAEAEPASPKDVPPVFVPLIALEALAAPSWYINILATYPEARRQGAATGLMGEIEARARSAGFRHLSLIVGDANPAKTLYEGLGFQEMSCASTVAASGAIRDAYWVLMKKKIN